ncbi:hypothetical protein BS47DRAFT_1359030 [Hydnum rufescens UP504]|uniref:Uncharacterized protein n=1 Tax=Hydnum rufescens UP504 TaxID=1448309 RepID=A0A9P6B5S8_9AGAM|nr:hypothetical protein BS47DRAFT_1359030 [Hydnum rufescens UP504]
MTDLSAPPSSYAARNSTPQGDLLELTHDSLDKPSFLNSVVDSVRRDRAGAVALFIGTTRDEFQGKTVTRLEYQAYTRLAMKTLSSIIEQAHTSWTQPTDLTPEALLRVAVIHRLGAVPVGQTSIIIAVSSPHRREAFEACEWILEQVKLKVQIWKREWYAGSEDAY